jgi:peptidyl-prolyl cis-trans isomerase B (cyclophilin B)
VPSADKRQRKKENARAAREAREAEIKKQRRNRTIRNGAIAAGVFVVGFGFLTWINGGSSKKAASTTTTSTTPFVEVKKLPTKGVTATIKTALGNIVLALDSKNDPIAARHFASVAKSGAYNGSAWTRIVKDFVIQGGAPGGDKTATFGHPVVGEVPKNHYPVGVVAAAKKGSDPPGTFDSEFFIVTGASQGATLANDYARFATVKSGMDVVRKIEAIPADPTTGDPTTKVTIVSVTIKGA